MRKLKNMKVNERLYARIIPTQNEKYTKILTKNDSIKRHRKNRVIKNTKVTRIKKIMF